MNASVTYRKVGDRWHIRFRAKGKKEIVKTYPGTLYEKTIDKKCTWFREEISMGREDPWTNQAGATGNELIADLIEDYCNGNLESGNWSRQTYKTNCSRLINTLSPVLERYPSMLTGQEFQQCLDAVSVKPVTKKGCRATVNSFLKFLHAHQYTADQYKVSLSVPDKISLRNESHIKYLTRQQIHDICSATRFWHRQIGAMYNYSKGRGAEFYCDLYQFLFYSLLRRSEVTKIKGKHYTNGELTVYGKGRTIDTIPLPSPADKIIKKYISGPEEIVFTTDLNRAKVHLKRSMKLALGKQKGLFHTFRHSGIVYYLSEGVPIQFVSKLARHKSIQTTLDAYGDVVQDKMKEAFSGIK